MVVIMRMADWLNATTTSRVRGIAFHLVETPAAAVVIRLDREDDFKRKVRLAFIALADDPGCIEAPIYSSPKIRPTITGHLPTSVRR